MKDKFDTDDFLARWNNDQLTEKEKVNFEQSPDFKWYQAIIEGTEVLELPPFQKVKAYEKVKMKANTVLPGVKSLIPYWAYGAAASVLIMIGLFFYINNDSTVYETGFGEQMTIVLPDGSELVLNAQSTLSYEDDTWERKRVLNLVGQAYFRVKKGKTFEVNTKAGAITVLGTRFSVQEDESIFEVICFEGSVNVENKKHKQVLKKGEAVRYIEESEENWSTTDEDPSWIQGHTSFENAPLNQVLVALGKHYAKKIEFDKIDIDQRFTGSFAHSNLELALRTVCESMEISYHIKDGNTIVFVTK